MTSCKPVRICNQHTFLFFREASIYLRRITGTSVRCLEEIFIRQRVRNVADLPVYWIPLGKFCWTLYLLVIRILESNIFWIDNGFALKAFRYVEICRQVLKNGLPLHRMQLQRYQPDASYNEELNYMSLVSVNILIIHRTNHSRTDTCSYIVNRQIWL